MTHIPTLEEIRSEPDPTRKAILEAMLRIAEGRPLHVPIGANAIVALADEAQVKRHWLNGKHIDLRKRFKYIADNILQAPPDPPDDNQRVAQLNARIEELEALLQAAIEERNHWKTSAEIFIRAMNVQEVDLARRDKTITRLQRKLEEAKGAGQDEIGARRHRRQLPSNEPPDVG